MEIGTRLIRLSFFPWLPGDISIVASEALSRVLKTQLGAAPVTALGIPLDCVVRSQTDPVGKRAVGTLRLGERTLQSETLLR